MSKSEYDEMKKKERKKLKNKSILRERKKGRKKTKNHRNKERKKKE